MAEALSAGGPKHRALGIRSIKCAGHSTSKQSRHAPFPRGSWLSSLRLSPPSSPPFPLRSAGPSWHRTRATGGWAPPWLLALLPLSSQPCPRVIENKPTRNELEGARMPYLHVEHSYSYRRLESGRHNVGRVLVFDISTVRTGGSLRTCILAKIGRARTTCVKNQCSC